MNGQDVATPKPKRLTAHIACEDEDAINNDEDDEYNDDAYDETATFLAGCLSDSRSDHDDPTTYDTLQASAMMIEDTLLFGGSDPVQSTNEVPRPPLDANPEDQKHGDRAHGLSGAGLTVPPTNEVPRPSKDENLDGQIHGDGRHRLTSPNKSKIGQDIIYPQAS